jgi:hypothetical protein
MTQLVLRALVCSSRYLCPQGRGIGLRFANGGILDTYPTYRMLGPSWPTGSPNDFLGGFGSGRHIIFDGFSSSCFRRIRFGARLARFSFGFPALRG